jgi:diaminopimelate epimerase
MAVPPGGPSGRLDDAMRLTKHHGLGNDFLVLLDPDASHPLDPDVARALCDRHTGLGADGVIRATPAATGAPAGVRMELRNADGSRAEMSGNGIRCLGQALVLGWPGVDGEPGSEIVVETDAGRRTLTVHGASAPATLELSAAMGGARLEGGAPEWTGGPVVRAMRVDMGNPHLVLDVSAAGPGAADEIDLVALGEAVNAKVDGGANVHLVTVADGGDGIAVRTYERGVGPTLACGTGACASAEAARAWGLAGGDGGGEGGRRVPVAMPGGEAEVVLGAAPGDEVVLRGPAVHVATIDPAVSPWR